MASTTFTDNQTVIYAAWLNDVNNAVYNGIFVSPSITATSMICNGTASGAGFTNLINNTFTAPGPIGSVTPGTGAFTTLQATGAFTGTTGAFSGAISGTNGTFSGTVQVPTLNTPSGVLSTRNGITGIAKAWVNYNGNTNTILGSFNVSSVTVNATGDYFFNFTTAMGNTTYSAVYAQQASIGGAYGFSGVTDQSSLGVRVTSMNNSGGGQNSSIANLIVMSS
jgi:hypothetical protein